MTLLEFGIKCQFLIFIIVFAKFMFYTYFFISSRSTSTSIERTLIFYFQQGVRSLSILY